MIPAGFLQDLLARVDIVEVVGRHVELKRGGANWMGLCPFHSEKSPSFSVSPSKQFYYCFGCGASGDALRFLTDHLGLSFVDAVEDLAARTGMQVPRETVSPQERERRQKLSERRLSLTEVLSRAAEAYRGQLRQSQVAIGYLKRRGLTGEVAARFGLGWAPEGWRFLANVFPRYDDPLLEEAGLVRAPAPEPGAPGGETPEVDPAAQGADTDAPAPADRRRYDWFRARVMFPIRSVQGEIIGFGGRVLDDSKPKYMNSPETAVFSKGRELYGLFEARQAIREKGFALVVEGYMDVVALAQNGFGNAVATLGTACTAEHVQKLFRFTDTVVFSFDGDAAGRRAAGRALEASLPHATDLRTVRFLFLPPEHDPDSFVRSEGRDAFEAAVAAAVPLSRQLIEHAADGADTRTPEGRARMLAQARPLWQQLPDGAYKRQLLGELAREAELGADELATTWRAGQPGGPVRREGQRPPKVAAVRRAPSALADLAVRLLMRHGAWWDDLDGDDRQLLLDLPAPHGGAIGWLEQQWMDHGPLPWPELAEMTQGHALQAEFSAWAAASSLDEGHGLPDLQRVVQRLRIEHLAETSRALALEAASDPEALARLREVNARLAALKAGAPPG